VVAETASDERRLTRHAADGAVELGAPRLMLDVGQQRDEPMAERMAVPIEISSPTD
jgi:hypothetical protein